MRRPPRHRPESGRGPEPVPGGRNRRFPGFDVTDQAARWDRVTAAVVAGRTRPENGRLSFFGAGEAAVASALLDRLLAQDHPPRIPVLHMIDERLAAGRTDGWRYEDMPEDGDAWRRSLAALDADARARHGRGFAALAPHDQNTVVRAVGDHGSGPWHGMPADRVWSLWTRYACTAFWSHPWAWNEMGFGGPAYPRGYLRPGSGRREPWEVPDADPRDPVAQGPPGGDTDA